MRTDCLSFRWVRCAVVSLILLGVALVLHSTVEAQQRAREPARQEARPPNVGPLGFPGAKDFPQFFKPLDDFFGGGSAEENQERNAQLDKIEISADEEKKIGKQEFDAFKQRLAAKKTKLRDKGTEVAYLGKLLAMLQAKMEQARRYRNVQVYYYDSDEPQAYMLTGGTLLVSQGMFKAAGSEAALVCVLGHELSHLDRGHLLRRAKQVKLFEQGMKPSGDPQDMSRSFDTMTQMFRRPFGPQDELEADTDGIRWAYELGYDPQTIVGVYAAVDKPAFPGGEFMPAFFRTHPPSAERRENMQTTLAALVRENPQSELYVGRENLQRRIPKSERRFRE